MQPAAFTPTRKAASGRLDHQYVALFGPSVVTQVQRSDPRASGASGVARHKPGPGRGVGPAQGDVTPSRMAAAVLKPDQDYLPECNQQPSRPLRKAASGRLDTPQVALFGPSVVTQVERPDPRASGARGVARPKPGPGRGAGPVRGDLTPGRWRPGSSSPIKPVSRNATSSLHAHSEGCFGEGGPSTRGPFRASRGNPGAATRPPVQWS